MNRPENNPVPVPGTDFRRYAVCCDHARRKEQRPGLPRISGFRFELYDCHSPEQARERFATTYEFTGDLRVREVDF